MHFAWEKTFNWCNLLLMFFFWGGVLILVPFHGNYSSLSPNWHFQRFFLRFMSVHQSRNQVCQRWRNQNQKFGNFRRRVFTLKFHTILIFNWYGVLMNLLFLCVYFLCVCVCDNALCQVCLKAVCLFLLLATWLLTQHINRQEFNWIIITVTIIKTIIQNGNSWHKMYNKL